MFEAVPVPGAVHLVATTMAEKRGANTKSSSKRQRSLIVGMVYLAQYGDWMHVFLPVETGSSSFMVVELLATYVQ